MNVANTIAEKIKLNKVLGFSQANSIELTNGLLINCIKGSPKGVTAIEIIFNWKGDKLYQVLSYNANREYLANSKSVSFEDLTATVASQTGFTI